VRVAGAAVGGGSRGRAGVEGVGGARDARRLVRQLVVEARGAGLAVVGAGVGGQREVEDRVAVAPRPPRAPVRGARRRLDGAYRTEVVRETDRARLVRLRPLEGAGHVVTLIKQV